MLVYIREAQRQQILAAPDWESIPDSLKDKFQKEDEMQY